MEYTLNNLLDMDKDTFKMITSELSKTQLTQINSILTEYKSKNKIEIGDPDNIMLKLNYTKKAISDAVKSTIEKVKVHIKTNAEIVSVKPSSTPAPKASTPKSNVNKVYGVNPLDYNINSSKSKSNKVFDGVNPPKEKFKKASGNEMSGDIIRVSVANIESKVIAQLKSIIKLGAGASGSVQRQNGADVKQSNREQKFKLADAKTALDNRKLDIRQKDADVRHEHVEAIKYKNKSADLMGKRKIRYDEKTLEMKLKGNALADEFRVQLEKTKKSKLKLAGDIQRDIINAKGEDKRKSMNIENASKERMLIQKHEYAKEKELDKKKSREQARQSKAKNDSQKNTKANLDSIHPALGLLYKLHKDREEKSEEGSGNFLGTAAGTALGSMGGGLMKGKGLRSGLGGIGIAGLMGLLETQKSGSMGKGAATFAGSIAGMELGAQAGLFVSGGNPIGGIIGGMIGGVLGETGAKQLYEKLFGKDKDTPVKPNSPKDINASDFVKAQGRDFTTDTAKNVKNGFNPKGGRSDPQYGGNPYQPENGRDAPRAHAENIKNGFDSHGGFIKNESTESGTNSKSFLNGISQFEGKTYNTLNGGSEGDLTNKTLDEISEMQKHKENFPGGTSRAVGKYQMTSDMFNETVKDSGYDTKTTKFTPEIQDALFMRRLKKSRKYDDFVSGKITREQFADQLASELASLPMSNGKSRYVGIGNNKALMGRDKLLSIVDNLKQEKSTPMSKGIQDAGDALDSAMQQQKSKPINVIQQGDTSNTGGNVVNNTYVNPQNTDATIRALQLQRQMPASIL